RIEAAGQAVGGIAESIEGDAVGDHADGAVAENEEAAGGEGAAPAVSLAGVRAVLHEAIVAGAAATAPAAPDGFLPVVRLLILVERGLQIGLAGEDGVRGAIRDAEERLLVVLVAVRAGIAVAVVETDVDGVVGVGPGATGGAGCGRIADAATGGAEED